MIEMAKKKEVRKKIFVSSLVITVVSCSVGLFFGGYYGWSYQIIAILGGITLFAPPVQTAAILTICKFH